MPGRTKRPEGTQQKTLISLRTSCEQCGQPLWADYHAHRKVSRLDGVWNLTLIVRRCHQPSCPAYKRPYRLGSKREVGPCLMVNLV